MKIWTVLAVVTGAILGLMALDKFERDMQAASELPDLDHQDSEYPTTLDVMNGKALRGKEANEATK